MRVRMNPGRMTGSPNPYIAILVEALASHGVEVRHWRPILPATGADVFHLHWPESVVQLGPPARSLARAALWSSLAIARAGRVPIVWTAHNLVAQSPAIEADPAYQRFLARFLRQVDGFIALSHASVPLLEQRHPVLRDKWRTVIRHPSYPAADFSRQQARSRAGIAPDARVFAAIGTQTRAKGIARLIELFEATSRPGDVLLLAGDDPQRLSCDLPAVLGQGSVVRIARRLTEPEVALLHAAADAIVFLGASHLNSGTILRAWSLGRTVLASRSAPLAELAALVGADAVRWIDDDAPASFRRAADGIVAAAPAPDLDLGAFSPSVVAERHADAYAQLVRLVRGG